MKKQILFFDIDGTLLNHKGSVNPSTKEALVKLRENGHLCFVCTGRTKCMVPKAIFELNFDGFVYGGGTSVEHEGRKIVDYVLPYELVVKGATILNKYKVSFLFEGTDFVYMEESAMEDPRTYFSVFVKSLGDIAKVIHDYHEVKASKITLLVSRDMSREEFLNMQEELSEEFDVIIHESMNSKVLTDGLIELMPKGYSKATGIHDVITHLEMGMETTIGIGDSNNDLEMFAYVETAVCMGNGTEKAKELADYVTTEIDQDGIYKAVEHLGLL